MNRTHLQWLTPRDLHKMRDDREREAVQLRMEIEQGEKMSRHPSTIHQWVADIELNQTLLAEVNEEIYRRIRVELERGEL